MAAKKKAKNLSAVRIFGYNVGRNGSQPEKLMEAAGISEIDLTELSEKHRQLRMVVGRLFFKKRLFGYSLSGGEASADSIAAITNQWRQK